MSEDSSTFNWRLSVWEDRDSPVRIFFGWRSGDVDCGGGDLETITREELLS